MAERIDLIAENREDSGKGASRRLRRSGKIPAIIYGAGEPARAVVFDRNSLLRQMENESFFSSVLTVQVNGKEQAAIVKDLQRHPALATVLHVDLQRIVADEKIRMNVPLHFLNEEAAVGVKLGGGTVSRMQTEVEVSCLPKDLPEYLDVDIEDMELDQMLYLSDIKLPEGVELTDLTAEQPRNDPIVTIHILLIAEEVEEVEDEELEGEELEGVEGEEAAAEEGAEPKEGESADKGDKRDKSDKGE
jgi:large subunit ribosomal protein L25